MIKQLLTASFLICSFFGYSQSVDSLMGRPLNDLDVQTFINSLEGEPVESFIPFRKSYKLSFKEAGVEMEFNSNLSLYQVNLYDSGYTFNQFKGELPYEAYWGVDSVSLQTDQGIMKPIDQNPFVKYYHNPNYNAQFYFRNSRLEHMRIIATNLLMKHTAESSLQSWGMRLLPNGRKVKGDVVDGEGVMVWGNSTQYIGEWSYGLPHGLGEWKDSFGNVYAGEFKLGFFWGEGKYRSKSYNFEYRGNFVMGKQHGQGTINYTNGSGYIGEWYQNAMHGKGQYVFTPQYYYTGEMYNNAITGKGTLTTPDGYVKGKFKNGKPHGYCEQYASQSQQTLSGYWRDGLKQGEFNLNQFGYDRKVIYKDDVEVMPEEQVKP